MLAGRVDGVENRVMDVLASIVSQRDVVSLNANNDAIVPHPEHLHVSAPAKRTKHVHGVVACKRKAAATTAFGVVGVGVVVPTKTTFLRGLQGACVGANTQKIQLDFQVTS